ncbi:MAG: hypothetical protein EA384_05070 [Spirochaetaceae bacterium]|nr:MAG: hypothetical protein EA384_05070 [Spirochaetaceae bacterium]
MPLPASLQTVPLNRGIRPSISSGRRAVGAGSAAFDTVSRRLDTDIADFSATVLDSRLLCNPRRNRTTSQR